MNDLPKYLYSTRVQKWTDFRTDWFTKMNLQSVCCKIPGEANRIYRNLHIEDHLKSFVFKAEASDCLLSELVQMIHYFYGRAKVCFDVHPPISYLQTVQARSIRFVTLSFRSYDDLASALQISLMDMKATRFVEHFKNGHVQAAHILGFLENGRKEGRAVFVGFSQSHLTSWARERAFVQNDLGSFQGIWRTCFKFEPHFCHLAAPPTYNLSSMYANSKQDFRIQWTRVESSAEHYDPEAIGGEHVRGKIIVNLPGVLVRGEQLLRSFHNCHRQLQMWERKNN